MDEGPIEERFGNQEWILEIMDRRKFMNLGYSKVLACLAHPVAVVHTRGRGPYNDKFFTFRAENYLSRSFLSRRKDSATRSMVRSFGIHGYKTITLMIFNSVLC